MTAEIKFHEGVNGSITLSSADDIESLKSALKRLDKDFDLAVIVPVIRSTKDKSFGKTGKQISLVPRQPDFEVRINENLDPLKDILTSDDSELRIQVIVRLWA